MTIKIDEAYKAGVRKFMMRNQIPAGSLNPLILSNKFQSQVTAHLNRSKTPEKIANVISVIIAHHGKNPSLLIEDGSQLIKKRCRLPGKMGYSKRLEP